MHTAALPFSIRRSEDVISGAEITSTTERVHGLLRLDDDRLVLQWRVSRSTERVGMEIRTDRKVEPVREAVIPLDAIAGVALRWRWLAWPPGRHLVLTGSDLRAFEAIAGDAGLQLAHPAELSLRIGVRDRPAAEEFVGELALAVAERSLRAAEERRGLVP